MYKCAVRPIEEIDKNMLVSDLTRVSFGGKFLIRNRSYTETLTQKEHDSALLMICKLSRMSQYL